MVASQTFKEWQKAGKDQHSIIADPRFADADHLDFWVRNKSLISKIKFKPFDYTKAGVYGDQEWINLAKFDVKLAKQFDEVVQMHENKQPNHNADL